MISPSPRRLERRGDRPHDVVDVHEHVRRIAAADERQHAEPGALEQRQQRTVPRTIDHPGRRIVQRSSGVAATIRSPSSLLRPYGVRGLGASSLGARRAGRGRTRRRRGSRCARGVRRHASGGAGDCPGAFDVRGGVGRVVECVDDAGEMNHGVDPGKSGAQGFRLERRANHRRAARRLVRRTRAARWRGPRSRAPIRSAVEMAADETGRAGHRDGRGRIESVHLVDGLLGTTTGRSVVAARKSRGNCSCRRTIRSALRLDADSRPNQRASKYAPPGSLSSQRFLIDAVGLVSCARRAARPVD